MRPQKSDAELEEIRFRGEDARISAELPELKLSFASAPWEIEVSPPVLWSHLVHMSWTLTDM